MAHSIADDHVNPTPQRTVLLATDSKNSVLAEVSTDKTNHITYSVYGHQSAQQEVMTRLGFNGELREMQTRWYLLGDGYRAYNPRLMRFHSPDSWSPFGKGGLNPYMYCGGEPVMNKDPTGHSFFSFLRTGFNNLIDTRNTFISTYQAHRAVGQNPVSALSSSVNGGLLNTLGVPNPNGLRKLVTAPTNNLPTAKAGGLHQNMWGGRSSTPAPESNASLPGGGDHWKRSLQPANDNPSGSTSGRNNPALKALQKKLDQHPTNSNNRSTTNTTTTGHPSSYGSGASSGFSQGTIPSSSKPYPDLPPGSLDAGSVRKK